MNDAQKQLMECTTELQALLGRHQHNRKKLGEKIERLTKERQQDSPLELGRELLLLLSENYTNVMAIEAKRIFQQLPNEQECKEELLTQLNAIIESHFQETIRLLHGVDTRVHGVDTRVQRVDASVQGVQASVQGVQASVQRVDDRLEHSRQFSTVFGATLVGLGGILSGIAVATAAPAVAFIAPGVAIVGSVPLFYYGKPK